MQIKEIKLAEQNTRSNTDEIKRLSSELSQSVLKVQQLTREQEDLTKAYDSFKVVTAHLMDMTTPEERARELDQTLDVEWMQTISKEHALQAALSLTEAEGDFAQRLKIVLLDNNFCNGEDIYRKATAEAHAQAKV